MLALKAPLPRGGTSLSGLRHIKIGIPRSSLLPNLTSSIGIPRTKAEFILRSPEKLVKTGVPSKGRVWQDERLIVIGPKINKIYSDELIHSARNAVR